MSFGIFSGLHGPARTRRGTALRGMGLGATIPASCWDTAGFKECNADGWVVAERKCIKEGLAAQKYGGDWEKCKAEQAADYAYYGCALRLCPPPPVKRPLSSGGWTWRNTTPNASVKTFQEHLNIALSRSGYKPILADGLLGPSTCGAFAFVGGNYPELFANDPIANIGICQAFTNPTKVGSSVPEKMPTDPDAKVLDEKYAGLPWLERDARALTLQPELNRQLDANEYLPIKVTGMLDAPMCGAMLTLDAETGTRWFDSWGPIQMAECPAVTRPRKKPQAVVPVVVVAKPPSAPPPVVAPESPTSTQKSVSAMSMLGAGLLAALAVGGYAWYKSKAG